MKYLFNYVVGLVLILLVLQSKTYAQQKNNSKPPINEDPKKENPKVDSSKIVSTIPKKENKSGTFKLKKSTGSIESKAFIIQSVSENEKKDFVVLSTRTNAIVFFGSEDYTSSSDFALTTFDNKDKINTTLHIPPFIDNKLFKPEGIYSLGEYEYFFFSIPNSKDKKIYLFATKFYHSTTSMDENIVKVAELDDFNGNQKEYFIIEKDKEFIFIKGYYEPQKVKGSNKKLKGYERAFWVLDPKFQVINYRKKLEFKEKLENPKFNDNFITEEGGVVSVISEELVTETKLKSRKKKKNNVIEDSKAKYLMLYNGPEKNDYEFLLPESKGSDFGVSAYVEDSSDQIYLMSPYGNSNACEGINFYAISISDFSLVNQSEFNFSNDLVLNFETTSLMTGGSLFNKQKDKKKTKKNRKETEKEEEVLKGASFIPDLCYPLNMVRVADKLYFGMEQRKIEIEVRTSTNSKGQTYVTYIYHYLEGDQFIFPFDLTNYTFSNPIVFDSYLETISSGFYPGSIKLSAYEDKLLFKEIKHIYQIDSLGNITKAEFPKSDFKLFGKKHSVSNPVFEVSTGKYIEYAIKGLKGPITYTIFNVNATK